MLFTYVFSPSPLVLLNLKTSYIRIARSTNGKNLPMQSDDLYQQFRIYSCRQLPLPLKATLAL